MKLSYSLLGYQVLVMVFYRYQQQLGGGAMIFPALCAIPLQDEDEEGGGDENKVRIGVGFLH